MIVVSKCLIGVPCRMDGKSKLIPEIKALVDRGEAVAVCPEVLGGLPTPRTPSERQPDGRGSPRDLPRPRLYLCDPQVPQPLLRQGDHLRRHLHPHPRPRQRRLRADAAGRGRPRRDGRGIPGKITTAHRRARWAVPIFTCCARRTRRRAPRSDRAARACRRGSGWSPC